jgi:hypothetical protein
LGLLIYYFWSYFNGFVPHFESGRGVDSINSDFQPAVKIMGRFWGNDSDDEA